MGALSPQKFTITPEEFAAIQDRAKQGTGIAIEGNVGKASKLGVTISWDYDGTTLTIQCTDHPFFVGKEAIQDSIFKLVKGT